MTNRKFAWVMMAAAGIALIASGCASKESYSAHISYVLEPTKPLPEGLNAVAIIDAGVEASDAEGKDEARAKKWATIAANMMEQMIQDSAGKLNVNIKVAKRQDTAKIMAEKNMKVAGLVEGGVAAQTAKLLDVQGLITSKLNIRVEVLEGKQRTVSAASVAAWAGHHWGGGAGSVDTEEVSKISRNLTVQCSFTLMDLAGQALVQFSPPPFRKYDKKSPGPVFGSSKTEADLDSVDGIIGELVEQGTREFVSTIVPTQVDYAYELESSGGKGAKASAQGIRSLRSEDFEGAVQAFKAAIAEDPEDHKSAFALGVTYELSKNWEGALKAYRQALGMPGVGKEDQAMYTAAKDRVAAHKDRIRKAAK